MLDFCTSTIVSKAEKDAVLGALEANDIDDESSNEAATEVRQIIPEFFVLNSSFYAVL